MPEKHEFTVWKTIQRGLGPETGPELRKYVKAHGISVNDWVNDFFGKPMFSVSSKKANVSFIKVRPSDLGFEEEPNCGQICDRAQELGLRLCRFEDVVYARVQYKEQPNGGCIVVCVRLEELDGTLATFGFTRIGSSLWLHGRLDNPNRAWSLDSEFLFRFPGNDQTENS